MNLQLNDVAHVAGGGVIVKTFDVAAGGLAATKTLSAEWIDCADWRPCGFFAEYVKGDETGLAVGMHVLMDDDTTEYVVMSKAPADIAINLVVGGSGVTAAFGFGNVTSGDLLFLAAARRFKTFYTPTGTPSGTSALKLGVIGVVASAHRTSA